MGLYFEEFFVGQKIVTEKHTMTEDDIMTFAKLSGDDNRIHTDPEFSKTTPFGQQVAHGLLGSSIRPVFHESPEAMDKPNSPCATC